MAMYRAYDASRAVALALRLAGLEAGGATK
jgi:hypothetical protein